MQSSAAPEQRAYQIEIGLVVRLNVGQADPALCTLVELGEVDDKDAAIVGACEACRDDDQYKVVMAVLGSARAQLRAACPGAAVYLSPLVGVLGFEEV